MAAYDKAAANGGDEWDKQFFHNTPFSNDPPYYAGLVTPVIHYCMGGLAISADGRCLMLPCNMRRVRNPLLALAMLAQALALATCYERGL